MLAIRTLRPFTERIPMAWAQGTGAKIINPIRNNQIMPNEEYFFFGILRGSGEMFKRCLKANYTFYYADHAYLYNESFKKNFCYRITKNWHCNNEIINRPSDRYEMFKNKSLSQWKKTGEYILICPPSFYIQIFDGQFDWLKKTIETVKKFTDRKIIIREKTVPDQLYSMAKIKKITFNEEYSSNTLDHDLENAWCVITYNSMVAIDALIKGIPIFTDSKMSVAYDMAEKDFSKIENPYYPLNRENFLNHLAYSQSTIEEIANGTAYKLLNV